MALHASGEDYLEAILVLHKKMGMVRSVDVARHMEVSKPSVCHAVAALREGGFLTMDSDYFLHLTNVGREVAEQIYEKHRFFHRAADCRRRGPGNSGTGCLPNRARYQRGELPTTKGGYRTRAIRKAKGGPCLRLSLFA